jgi:hypothetical protein
MGLKARTSGIRFSCGRGRPCPEVGLKPDLRSKFTDETEGRTGIYALRGDTWVPPYKNCPNERKFDIKSKKFPAGDNHLTGMKIAGAAGWARVRAAAWGAPA